MPLIYVIAALLAFVGGALSLYFHLVYKKQINPKQVWVPSVCQMDSSQCTSIVDTKYGRLGRKPNSFYGSIFLPAYGLILILTAIRLVQPEIALILGGITIIAGVYLTIALFRLATYCPICLTVHGLNLLIVLLQLSALFLANT
ncbi:MAG: vitamin K epoxide reductase family protein [Candidatus Neomarinimicrobiota bacterium]